MSAKERHSHAIVQYLSDCSFSERRRQSDRTVIRITPFNWMIKPILESIVHGGAGLKMNTTEESRG